MMHLSEAGVCSDQDNPHFLTVFLFWTDISLFSVSELMFESVNTFFLLFLPCFHVLDFSH